MWKDTNCSGCIYCKNASAQNEHGAVEIEHGPVEIAIHHFSTVLDKAEFIGYYFLWSIRSRWILLTGCFIWIPVTDAIFTPFF